jgi:ParB-like chromosome segregation protein Spo0J
MRNIPISSIRPYEKNAKKHPPKQIKQIAKSIKEFGFNQPIVVDKQGVIIIGHGSFEAAKKLLLMEVPVEEVDLTEEQAKAYRLADNKLNESEWDMDLVLDELADLSLEMQELTGFESLEELRAELDNPYTSKVETPVYTPKSENPLITALYNDVKLKELQTEIEKSTIPDADKDFLKLAAYRHVVFDYSKIADYYASASKEVQDLMEKSALVIVDYDKAIELGFVELTKRLEEAYQKQHEA